MSKQSYLNGFCKTAEANGVDPKALARFAIEKCSQDGAAAAGDKAGMWEAIKAWLESAKNKTIDPKTWEWFTNRGSSVQSLIGAGAGAALGTGLGAAVSKKGKRKSGLTAGAILGAIAGASAPHVDWKAIANSFKDKKPAGGETAPAKDNSQATA